MMKDHTNQGIAERCDALQACITDLGEVVTELREAASAELAQQAALVKQQAREISEAKAGLAAAQTALDEERARRCEAEDRLGAELERRSELRDQLTRIVSEIEPVAPATDTAPAAETVGDIDRGWIELSPPAALPDVNGTATDNDDASLSLPEPCETALHIVLPEDLATACQALVAAGAAPDTAAAALELMRRGTLLTSSSKKPKRRRNLRE